MRSKLVYILLALQVVVLSGLYAWHWFGLQGEAIRLRAFPVDPRDLLRGDYVILGYDISQPPAGTDTSNWDVGQSIYVSLKRGEDDGEFWGIQAVDTQPIQEAAHLVRATWSGHALEYDIERYFVPEGQGNPPPPFMVDIVINRSQTAQIKTFYADGVPWPREVKPKTAD